MHFTQHSHHPSTHKRFYDPKFKCYSVSVLPGDFYVTNALDEMIVTVLGSCVSACIRNLKTGYGGLNHFLLAEPGESVTSPSNRYGSYAMEQLMNEILKYGGVKADFEVKIFGGADLFKSFNPVGTNNVRFIRQYLMKEGIKITAEDLGGNTPRKIYYWPSTGQVSRLLIAPNEGLSLLKQEENYKEKLQVKGEKPNSVAGSIVLF